MKLLERLDNARGYRKRGQCAPASTQKIEETVVIYDARTITEISNTREKMKLQCGI